MERCLFTDGVEAYGNLTPVESVRVRPRNVYFEVKHGQRL